MTSSYFSKFISFDALMPFMGLLMIVFIVLRLIGSKSPGFKKQQQKFYYYLLIQLAVMFTVTFIAYNLRQSTLMLRYFSLMVLALVLGGLHVYFFRSSFNKFDSDNHFMEFVFAFVTAAVLVIPIIMIGAHFDDLIFLPYYLLVVAAFVIPTSFYMLFNNSVSIPVKLYSKWYYPSAKKYDTPKHYELHNIIVLNFMFHKNPGEQHLTSFKAKAPKDMEFGRLFFFFINDYNDKKTTTKIEMTEDSGNPYGWYFYIKPKWYGASKHIDSELSVERNNLEDGHVVVCQRI
ncbi:MAG TPA: TssN family type VI secretion system protein [Pricia sp.]|nr:TssN family type VI secretion system protein [Pricia sp.]